MPGEVPNKVAPDPLGLDRRCGTQSRRSTGTTLLLFALSIQPAWATPTVVPDPNHPGYYNPFHCLKYDPDSATHGFLRNHCGHAVEAEWTNNDGVWGSWTLPAGGYYPVFDGLR